MGYELPTLITGFAQPPLIASDLITRSLSPSQRNSGQPASCSALCKFPSPTLDLRREKKMTDVFFLLVYNSPVYRGYRTRYSFNVGLPLFSQCR